MARLLRLVRRVRQMARAVRWGYGAGAGALLLVLPALLVLALTVYNPQLVIDSRGLSRTDWLTHVDNLRGQILQGLGGLALFGAFYLSVRTLRLNRRGQLTDRFGKAIEQLGSDSLAVRLGGIYALEQIAFDSAELHWPIMEVLTAYLREHAAVRADAEAGADTSGRRLPADHQAIATVIGRRRVEQDPDGQRLELSQTNLSGVRWAEACLASADLRGTRLERADLTKARLEGTDLREANLRGAHLSQATLKRALLWHAHLEEASLGNAHLKSASFDGAHLQGASLRWADLTNAGFRGAHLEKADLSGAQLEGAELGGAHLVEANLSGVEGLAAHQLLRVVGAHQARLPGYLRSSGNTLLTNPTQPEQPSASPPGPTADEPS